MYTDLETKIFLGGTKPSFIADAVLFFLLLLVLMAMAPKQLL